jgi:FHA domain
VTIRTERRRTRDRLGELLDSNLVSRETDLVLAPGASRQYLARVLNAAYVDGLLSENTFSHRLDELFQSRLVDPTHLIGDLSRRRGPDWRTLVVGAWTGAMTRLRSFVYSHADDQPMLLALDWMGSPDELVVGRLPSCEVVLSDPSVSRRHARLFFRDGSWLIQDLDSKNGTVLNGVRVGRSEVRPGDLLVLGCEHSGSHALVASTEHYSYSTTAPVADRLERFDQIMSPARLS